MYSFESFSKRPFTHGLHYYLRVDIKILESNRSLKRYQLQMLLIIVILLKYDGIDYQG